MEHNTIRNKGGRPPKLEADRRSKNKHSVYISDRELDALGISNREFKRFVDTYVTETIKAKNGGEQL